MQLKDSTYKLLRYRLSKKGFDLDRDEIGNIVELVFSRKSWALQYLANLVGRLLEPKDSKLNELQVAQLGSRALEALEGKVFKVYESVNIHGHTTLTIFPERFIENEPEEHKIKPETDKIVYESKKDYIHKRFWRGSVSDLDLDTLDILNNVEFTIDEDIAALRDNSYDKSEHSTLERSRSQEMIKEYMNRSFKFKHFYDTRGRVYSRGYHINPQGTKYKKAMLTMDNKEDKVKGIALINLIMKKYTEGE